MAMERIDKIIASQGLYSRSDVKYMVNRKRITIDGKVVTSASQKADVDKNEILLDGKPFVVKKQIYLMLHKPRGYVTTLSDEKGRPNAAQLVADCGCRVYPVGRLDMDSEGLLLFTNDGDFANSLMHPKHEVDKVYLVWVVGHDPQKLERLGRPVTLDGYTIRKPGVKLIRAEGDRALLQVTIHEGRNRQIRRMCEMAGMKVRRLKRIAEGALMLGDLPLGKWRHLTAQEVAQLGK